jgi:hypothetical protein
VRTVFFIGLDQLAGKIDFGDGGQLRAVYKTEPEEALQAVSVEGPDLIVANSRPDDSGPMDFVSMARTCYPELRVPIILVDLNQPDDDAVINEYDEREGAFYERQVPLRFLKEEIRRACGLERTASDELDPDEVRNIGRNEFIKRGDRKFNIQTEIMIGETVKIKTTIFEGGAILDHTVNSFSRTEKDIVHKLMKSAGSQHYEAVAKVRRGAYD